MKLFSLKHSVVGVVVMFIVMVSCSSEETVIEPFVNESFEDLTIETFQNLESPYEAIFGQSSGGRVTGDFADLAEIAAKLEEIFPDVDILEIESDMERGLEVWEIKLKMPGGGILKLRFVQELGEIIKMKGVTGPFDYEIDPGGSFISFQAAKALALEAVHGEIHAWSLELEEDNEWEYEFHIVNGDRRFEVEIRGFGLEVISIREKDHDEDEDNDGEDEGDEEDDDGDHEEDNIDAPEAVVHFAQELFEGTIKHSEREHTDNGTLWKLYLINKEEAAVKMKLLVVGDDITLVSIEGEHGPFNYNIEPGMELLSLVEVLENVYRETEEAELIEWRLSQDHAHDEPLWIYEFKLKSETARYYVKINADTGEFLVFEVED